MFLWLFINRNKNRSPFHGPQIPHVWPMAKSAVGTSLMCEWNISQGGQHTPVDEGDCGWSGPMGRIFRERSEMTMTKTQHLKAGLYPWVVRRLVSLKRKGKWRRMHSRDECTTLSDSWFGYWVWGLFIHKHMFKGWIIRLHREQWPNR